MIMKDFVMKFWKNTFLMIGVLSLFLSCQGSEDDKTTQQYLEQYKDHKEPLAVDYHSPVGEIKVHQNKVIVHFTQPMVALASLKDQGTSSEFVEIIPQPEEGYFKWVNTKTLVYQAKGDLPYATQFKVIVKAGKESLLGFALIKDFEFQFNTLKPAVTSVVPGSGATQIRLDQKFEVIFNQHVNIEEIKSFIRLSDVSQKNYSFDLECHREKETDPVETECYHTIILPKERFAKSTPINLEIQPGFKGVEGDLPAIAAYTAAYSTFGDFVVSAISCRNRQCDPNPAIGIHSSTPISEEGFEKFIEFNPPVAPQDRNNGYWSSSDSCFYFYPRLKPNQQYTITVSPEILDQFGQKLGAAKTAQIATTHYSPQFQFPYFNDQVINTARKQDFGFKARNVQNITARFRTDLTDLEVMEMASEPNKVMMDFDQNSLWNSVQSVAGGFDDQFHFYPIAGDAVLSGKSAGIVVAAYQSPDVTHYNYETKLYEQTRFWFIKQITDLAINAKFAPYNSLVWVTSLNTGESVAGAQIKIYNKHGKELFQGITREDGLLDVPGRDELVRLSQILEKDSAVPEHFPFYVFATTADDRAFVTTEWSEGLGGYSYLSDYMYEEEASDNETDEDAEPVQKHILRAHVFTDRGLYKPGEDVYLKGYLREVTDQGLKPFSQSVKLVIDEPRGDAPVEIDITPNARGNFSATYKVPESNALGYYSFWLKSENKGVEFSSNDFYFQVEKFRTPELKVDVTDAKGKNFKGEPLQVKVNSNYLFGAPVKQGKGYYSVTKSQSVFSPKQTDDFQFGRLYENVDEYDDSFYSYYVEKDFNLDDEGTYQLSVETENKVLDPVEYTIESSVTDASGQTISGREQIMVHPAEYYIGAKTDKFFYNVGDKAKPTFATLDLDGQFLSGQTVHVDLVAVKWITVKKETLYGQFESEVERKEEVLSACDKVIQGKDNICEFDLGQAGYFYFRLTSKDSKARVATTEIPFYVTGGEYAFWPSGEAHVIELVKDKANYKVGDVAKIIVKSPYKSVRALVALERNKVLRYFVTKLEGGTPVIELPITEADAPNVFVRVVLIKGALDIDPSHQDTKSKVEQALVKAGTVELPIEPLNKSFAVEVNPEKPIYKPGETAKISFKVPDATAADEAELTVMVVDEGVLLAGGYTLQDPLTTFFAPYAHDVHQVDGRIYYVGSQGENEKLEDPSAGGGEMSGFRKKFIPSAYFNPEVVTTNGVASIEFTVPDQLTNFKVMVVANHKNDRFSKNIGEFKTQKDVMIRPALPRFVRYGDTIESKVVLHNNTNAKLDAVVDVTSDLFKLVDGQTGTVTIPANSSKVHIVKFKVENETLFAKFKEAYDRSEIDPKFTSEVRFVAKSGSTEDAVLITVPVHFERPDETVATSGISTGVITEFLQKTDDIDENFGSLTVSLNGNLTARLNGKIQNLREYPYECLEQRIARVYPLVLFPNRDDLFQGKDADATYRKDQIESLLAYMRENQGYRGDFKLWPNSLPTPNVTLLAVQFLRDAQIAGFNVDSMIAKAKPTLFRYLQQTDAEFRHYSAGYLNQLKVDTLYAFYLWNEPQIGYYEEMRGKFHQFEEISQNHLIEMFFAQNSQDPLIDTWLTSLKNSLRLKGSTAYVEPMMSSGYYFGNNARVTTARVLQTLLKIDPAHPFVFQLLMYLVDEKASSSYLSSSTSLATLKALRTYQVVFPNSEKDVQAKLTLNDKDILKTLLTLQQPTDQLKMPLDKLPKDMQLKIHSETANPLFYDVKYKYVLKNYRTFGVEQGVSLTRDYYDIDGKLVQPNQFQHGATYKVVLNLYFADNSEYVVIDEALPAGMEPLNLRLNTTRSAFAAGTVPTQGTLLNYYLDHSEFHDKQLLLFANHVPRGFYTYEYHVNVTNSGGYFAPASKAFEMYAPEVFGSTAPQTVEIH